MALRGPAGRTIWPFPSGTGISVKPLDSSAVAESCEIFAAADAQMRSRPATYAHKKKNRNPGGIRIKRRIILEGNLDFRVVLGCILFSPRGGAANLGALQLLREKGMSFLFEHLFSESQFPSSGPILGLH